MNNNVHGHEFDFCDVRLDARGTVSLIVGLKSHTGLSFELRDQRGAHSIQTIWRQEPAQINLLRASDRRAEWSLEDARPEVTLGLNFRPQWSISGEDTSYVRVVDAEGNGRSVTVRYVDPLTQCNVPIEPLKSYVFSLLVAAHRCAGEIQIAILDKFGGILDSFSKALKTRFIGGTDRANYEEVLIPFVASSEAHAISISIVKAARESSVKSAAADSFLFFASPSLTTDERWEQCTLVPAAMLARARDNIGYLLRRIEIRLPALTDPFDIAITQPYSLTIAKGLRLPRNPPVTVQSFQLFGSTVTVGGTIDEVVETPELAAFVDGIESTKLVVQRIHGKFYARGELKLQHRDGRRHMLEVRLGLVKAPIVARRLSIELPDDGGEWGQKLADFDTAMQARIAELDLLRQQLRDARLAVAAAATVNSRIMNLAPLISEISEDFNRIKSCAAPFKSVESQLPAAVSAAPTSREATSYENRLSKSALFDEEWYRKRYMSEKDGHVSPAKHYLNYGVVRDLAPHPLFDARWYFTRYMPATSLEPPFLHFLREGAKREYFPHPVFDLSWFAQRYKRQGLVDCMIFFQRYAFECDLDPHPLFDSKWYRTTYPEVSRKGSIGLHDYMTEGFRKGRWPNAVFDPTYYARTYKDTIAPNTNPLVHFIEQGSENGFNPNPLFSSAWYRAVNPDVVRDNWIPLAHYLRVGGAIGLDPSLSLRTKDYLRANPSLDIAKESVLAHALRARPTSRSTKTRTTPKSLESSSRRREGLTTLDHKSSDDLRLPSINWVIGPEDNIQWAYGNNAKRFISHMPRWTHEISGHGAADIIVYFDVIVADRYPVPGKNKILRIGGPRPIDRMFGDDPDRLREGLASFDAVIALSPSLLRRVSEIHPNAILIPNGLDLGHWKPRNINRANTPFTVGVAASAKSTAERDVKGIDIAIAAAEQARVPILLTHKGPNQIPHDRMIEDFYAKIDVLLHPVAPGREGSSNVIMEALAMGVPVVTTVGSGYHGECLQDGIDGLIRTRKVDDIVKAIIDLRDNPGLAQRISEKARIFAVEHHDIVNISAKYEALFQATLMDHEAGSSRSIGFFPFWKPTRNFASSRLRADFPASLLAQAPCRVSVSETATTDVDVAVVIQSAEDPLYETFTAKPETFVVYDVCDRYFENSKVFKTPSGPVDSLVRFEQLIARANVIVTPTIELKAEIARRFPHKPVYYVPEMIDYSRGFRDAVPTQPKRALWFGSPQRGNFESARWLLDAMTEQLGYELRIVSRKSFFSNMQDYVHRAVEWSLDTFLQELQAASICIVSHSEEERTKSPNRFVTAVAHGVPTIVFCSQPSAHLLRSAGCEWAVVDSLEGLAQAVRRLEDANERSVYLRKTQEAIEAEHGNRAVRSAYLELILKRIYDTHRTRKVRVAYVTHNLNYGEGAPKSLFELAIGLRNHANIEPFIYCVSPGDLIRDYEKEGIAVRTFTNEARPPMRVLNQSFQSVCRNFQSFLVENQIDYVLANTIKSAPFVTFANEVGIPASIIIRESFEKKDRFNYYAPLAQEAAERALLLARSVIFVSENTSRYWMDQAMTPNTRLVKNGVNVAPFRAALELDKTQARKQLGIDADFIAICVGTINERKGQVELARWYQSLPHNIRNRVTIMFVGATENAGLQKFEREYDMLPPEIRQNLKVVKTTPDIGMYYRASDIFLMNSSQESYPRSTMEALLFGLPVVSTPVFGVLEQVEDGTNGFLVPFNDAAAWRLALTKLLIDPTLLSKMSENAATSFWKLTTYAEMLNDYRAIVSPFRASNNRLSSKLMG